MDHYDYNWKNGSNFTSRQFYTGIALLKKSNKKCQIDHETYDYNFTYLFFKGLYEKIDDEGFHYGIYERAIKLGRRSISPYNQDWVSSLIYS
jgi:hypothetical protein